MAEKVTKIKQIENHLKTYGSITPWDAITKFKATRLSAEIFELKKRGMNIKTEIINGKDCNGNPDRYAKYIYLPN